MANQKIIDHLFRHQHGKMVSILVRIFGFEHLETIEDAVQDTFVKAMLSWRNGMPDNPEAWLTAAAKNRAIDLFRKLNADQTRHSKLNSGPSAIAFNNLFLDNEIADSQLRMVFTACHPELNPKDQIAFALKTISGFSAKEIASALLLKEETIKKRLSRARKVIKERSFSFEIPQGNDLPNRLNRVLEVLYLIFNEGFHSNKKDILIRKELCGEAMRLTKMLLANKLTNIPSTYALFAMMCFHSARLPAKINDKNELIDLKNQDRKLWHFPLVAMGNEAMNQAIQTEELSSYHFEAAIAGEHHMAKDFDSTNWDNIFHWSEQLYLLQPTPFSKLNIATIQLQRHKLQEAFTILQEIAPADLEQRAYLYFGTLAEYYILCGDREKALFYLDEALKLVRNEAERGFLLRKRELWS